MKPPVFIVGCDRSGTTLLSLLLDQSLDLCMTLESGFIPKLYSKKDSYNDFKREKERWYFIRDLQSTHATSKTYAFNIFGITDDEAEEAIHRKAPTDYAGAIDALFSRAAELAKKKRWGNKTPHYIYHIDLITNLFPESKIIHIVRDPRDVASSIYRAGWTSTIKEAAQIWNERVSKGLEGRNLGEERYYEIRYEKLLNDPEHQLEKICDWLNISLRNSGIENYKEGRDKIPDKHKDLFDLIGKPIDKSRAYAWKKNMSKADIADVEGVNRQLIKKTGYELTGYKVTLRKKIFRSWIFYSKKAIKKAEINIEDKL